MHGDPLYKPIRYVPLQRVWFLRRFGLKMAMVFEETKEVYERIINKKEREICEFDAKFKKCFLLAF